MILKSIWKHKESGSSYFLKTIDVDDWCIIIPNDKGAIRRKQRIAKANLLNDFHYIGLDYDY